MVRERQCDRTRNSAGSAADDRSGAPGVHGDRRPIPHTPGSAARASALTAAKTSRKSDHHRYNRVVDPLTLNRPCSRHGRDTAPQTAAGSGAGVAPVVNHDFAVDDDHVYAIRIPGRVVECRVGLNERHVDQH